MNAFNFQTNKNSKHPWQYLATQVCATFILTLFSRHSPWCRSIHDNFTATLLLTWTGNHGASLWRGKKTLLCCQSDLTIMLVVPTGTWEKKTRYCGTCLFRPTKFYHWERSDKCEVPVIYIAFIVLIQTKLDNNRQIRTTGICIKQIKFDIKGEKWHQKIKGFENKWIPYQRLPDCHL